MKKIILFLFFAIWAFLANAQSVTMYLPAGYYNDQPGPFNQVVSSPLIKVICDGSDVIPDGILGPPNKILKRKHYSGNYTSACMFIQNFCDLNKSGSFGDCIDVYSDQCIPDYYCVGSCCEEMEAWTSDDITIATEINLDPNHQYVNGDHIHLEYELRAKHLIGSSHCWDLFYDLYFVVPSTTLNCHCLTGTHDIKAFESISFTNGFCYYASGSDYMTARVGEADSPVECDGGKKKSAILYPDSTSNNNIDVAPKSALISQIEETKFNVFPNPTSGKLEISSNTICIQSIEIISPTGLQLFNINNLNTLSKDIDFTSYPDGLYIVKIKTDEGIVTKKIVKTHN
jgi:hypothetical protein